MSSSFWICFLALVFTKILLVSAHSQMKCAKWDPNTGNCAAGIRNEGSAFLQEAYLYTYGAPICQSPWTNPISGNYANGPSCPDYAPCPDPMGTYAPGESFTVMWWARNHAVADQDPATVYLYMSPIETANQGQDISYTTMMSHLICSGPYANCDGLNGNTVNCTLNCQMPSSTPNGLYTLWWKWDWQGVMYTTCADINVSGSSSVPPSTPVTTAKQPTVTTGKQQPVQPSTTGKQAIATTGSHPVQVPATTGSHPVQVPATTGSHPVQVPSTTGSHPVQVPSTTGAAQSNGQTGQTCANVALTPSLSQAVMVSVDTWGSQYRGVIEIHAQEAVLSNWMLELIFPSNQQNPTLTSAVNAGNIKCQGSTPVNHAVIQPNSWSKSVSSGNVLTIEVFGSNHAQLSGQDIMSNTQLVLYTQ
jgi:hypothetical protein